MSDDRVKASFEVRVAAAELARDRNRITHQANGDEQAYASANYAMSFTKGLKHDMATGLVADPEHFRAFRQAIDAGFVDPFTASVPAEMAPGRPWEAPTCGTVHDLQGPDAQAVTMPPAPGLGSGELAFEMAEVYELALLRDVPLNALGNAGPVSAPHQKAVKDAVKRLNHTGYVKRGFPGRPRLRQAGKLTEDKVFRGSSPGVGRGPYLSQFLMIGNVDLSKGKIGYGALQIDQRLPVAKAQDYMTTWADWHAAQEGADARDDAALFDSSKPRRFITTPRDLATYVHDDQLYEAYLNAALILLGMKTPFDPAFGALSGQSSYPLLGATSGSTPICRQAGGFALWGGPHLLTLVTEVATRALKAVRFQKFNTHLRLRPEALAARIEKSADLDAAYPSLYKRFGKLRTAIGDTVAAVEAKTGNALLPMAFQEGSPMHPSYGAGHATVAGACVTILKAWFDTGTVLVARPKHTPDGCVGNQPHGEVKAAEGFQQLRPGDVPVHYRVQGVAGQTLKRETGGDALTLEGELNKLAANISIGRNMAGVHYFSDYYDSLRMGEAIAIGILEEQALCYPTDRFVLTVPTFDGDVVRIGAR